MLLGNRSLLFVKLRGSDHQAPRKNTTKGLDISMLSLSGQPQRPTPQLLHLTQIIRSMRSGTYTFLHTSTVCHCNAGILLLSSIATCLY